ncbi:MAG: hypothetical protein JW884_11820 [Deltaproteobacteria bacterium]|nr:hypothetical protein [Deltaproteobacteria bacterium]
MNVNDLARFDLYFPGHWVSDDDRSWASGIEHTLGLVNNLFVEAVAAYALFQPFTKKNVLEYIKGGRNESPYKRCLNAIYAKAFIFALNNIGELLRHLSEDKKSPMGVQKFYWEYKNHFGHLKHIRDSAIHIKDRGRGLTRRGKPLETHFVILGSFIARRYTFTGEDGKHYEIEISDATLEIAKSIIDEIIRAYAWK